MNALIAVICTIGGLVLLGIVVGVIEKHGEGILMLVLALVFLVLPLVLSIWGVITGNFGMMIFAEVIAFVGSLLMSRDSNSITWINFVLLLPAILLLIACVVDNIVVGAVVMVLVGLFQVAITMQSFL